MDILQRDAQYIWHPFTQTALADPPLALSHASGSWLYTQDGTKLLDATSSWWVNAHGHAHPYIAAAIAKQAATLEHIIFAGFTHEPAVQLAERLVKLLPGKQEKIFFSDNGSTSVEVALKMAIQYFHNKGTPKTKIIAFKNAYHGDTFGGMSVAERNAFNQPFSNYLFEPIFIDAPEPGCENVALAALKLALGDDQAAAFIFEPLVQGASGMRMHQAETLSEMISLCRKAGVLTIADEVFTGFYRTGKLFACEYLQQQPDIICLSKALTGGFLPLAVTAVPQFIFDAFSSRNKYKTFFHGHSYTANPIACAAANASLDLFEEDHFVQQVKLIQHRMAEFVKSIAEHPRIKEIRHLGCILALELHSTQTTGYLNDDAFQISRWFLKRNIYIRPLGNVLYITPPFCISPSELDLLFENIALFLEDTSKS